MKERSASDKATDPLPSWADGPAKSAIVQFVQSVTEKGGKDYVPSEERIATFDNDGTLWVEYPLYTQLLFAADRVKALAPKHPEWKTRQPFKALLEGDMKTVGAYGMKGFLEIWLTAHTGMTAARYAEDAGKWLRTTRHEKFKRPYVECVYQPQLELLAYLRAHGFKTFIVSGGGMAFMRPILAFGNSDGDIQMIEYTTGAKGRRLGLFLHHTDGEREFAYDRKTYVGTLDKALDQAEANGWIIVDMKNDWKRVFAFEGME